MSYIEVKDKIVEYGQVLRFINALFPPTLCSYGDTSDTPRHFGAIESLNDYIGPRAPAETVVLRAPPAESRTGTDNRETLGVWTVYTSLPNRLGIWLTFVQKVCSFPL